MSDKELRDSLVKIFNHYGLKTQLGMLQEESAEAIQAVNKMRRYSDSKSTEHLVEEIADLYIVLSQLMIYYGPNRVNAIVEKKIARELKRISNNTMEV